MRRPRKRTRGWLLLAAVVAASAIAVPIGFSSSHREAPNIMLDPVRRQHRRLCLDGARSGGRDHARLRLDPRAGAGERAELLPVRRSGPVLQQHRQQRRRRCRHQVPVHVQHRRSQPELVPVRRAGTLNFEDPKLNVIQRYDVVREDYKHGELVREKKVAHNLPVAPPNIGPKTFPNYENFVAEATRTLRDGTKVFVGTRDDPFFVDLGATFDAINVRMGTGNEGAGQGRPVGVLDLVDRDADPRAARDAQRGAGRAQRMPSNAVVGVWSTTERRKLQVTNAAFDTGAPAQQASEQVGPGLAARQPAGQRGRDPARQKDKFNRTTPDRDAELYGKYVTDARARCGAERAVQHQRPGDRPHGHRPGAAPGAPRPEPALGQVRRHAG